jgi:hypothetical protein
MIFIVSVLLSQPNDIGWHIGILSATFTGFNDTLRQFYSVSFIIAYVVTWLATVTILHAYSYRLGKVKFWAFVILPLLYIIGEFQVLILPLLSEYRSVDPVTFTIVYTLTFNTIKFAGAFFFGIGFWSMARKIEQKSLKSFLNISAYGLILLFVTNQATLLLNTLFPPLGLMTACFVGLSSFLLLVGIFSSAINVSQDRELRREFYNTAKSELNLLRTIGVAEMEKELMKKYKSIDKRTRKLEEQSTSEKDGVKEALHGLVDEIDKDKAREILHDVLTELYAKSRTKDKF